MHWIRRIFKRRKIDRSFLPPGYRIQAQEGLVAKFYPDGQLKHLGYYVDGSCDDFWALHLEHGAEKGKVVLKNGYGGTADLELYLNGSYVRVDAWSDADWGRPCDFEQWVKRWISRIASQRVHVSRPRPRVVSGELRRMAESLVLDIQERCSLPDQSLVPDDLARQMAYQVQELRQKETDAQQWYYRRDPCGQWSCALALADQVREWQSQGWTYARLLDEEAWPFIAQDSTRPGE